VANPALYFGGMQTLLLTKADKTFATNKDEGVYSNTLKKVSLKNFRGCIFLKLFVEKSGT